MGKYDLRGSLRVIGVSDLLNLLQSSEKTGILHIRTGTQHIKIIFRQGAVGLVLTLSTNWNLLKALRDRELVTGEEIKQAEALCDDVGTYVGPALMGQGIIDPGSLIEITKELIPQEMAEVLKIREGEFEFHEGDPSTEFCLPVALPVPFVILHAAHLLDEIQRGELAAACEKGSNIRPRVGNLIQLVNDKVVFNYALRLGSTILGSAPTADIRMTEDPDLKPRHARIYLTGLNYYLDNLSESTSVRVNGLPVNRRQLFDGDEIEICRYRFLFHRLLLTT